MTIREKLQYIQSVSGLKQAELAVRLGVTFAALNRWFNGKAKPRKSAEERIDGLYREFSGDRAIPKTALEAKKKLVSAKQKKHPGILKEILKSPDICDAFLLALTFHSNKIEGSTLSENETATILFENVALSNKSLVEQLEAKNHQTALEFLFDHTRKGKPINEGFILDLHRILMNAIHSDAGAYRKHAVRILGTNVPTANYLKIPALMKKLETDIKRKPSDAFASTALIHSRFEQIHPFGDGNGRVGRLLIHAMLLRENLPPAIIKQEKRGLYMNCLNKAQMKEDASLLESFLLDAVLGGFEIMERKQK